MAVSPNMEIGYFLTLFKIEGHQTWRAFLGGKESSFDDQVQASMPKITERKVLYINRITGVISELK